MKRQKPSIGTDGNPLLPPDGFKMLKMKIECHFSPFHTGDYKI